MRRSFRAVSIAGHERLAEAGRSIGGGIAPERNQQPRIHDLRHTFATRVLEQCGAERGEVARHFVALSTYLGHVSIHNTYWYLEATPDMMTDIAAAAETLVGEDGL